MGQGNFSCRKEKVVWNFIELPNLGNEMGD